MKKDQYEDIFNIIPWFLPHGGITLKTNYKWRVVAQNFVLIVRSLANRSSKIWHNAERKIPNTKSQFRTIGTAFVSRDNNFDLIRLLAAAAVLVSHCYPLTGQVTEPFANYLGEYDTGGGWGVSIFFVNSGFLLTRSVLGRPVGTYFRSRIFRIIPALALVAFVESFLIGPVFTTLTLQEYLTNSETYNHLKNVSVFWIRQVLPETFAQNPEAYSINGSLWTLPIESAFYIALPCLAFIGLLRPWRIIALTVLTAAWLVYGVTELNWSWANQGGLLFPGGPAYYVAKEALFFLIGALFWVHRDRIPMNGYLAIASVLLLTLFAYREYRLIAFYIALPYLVIYVAFAKQFRLRLYDKIGDLSYGTYLFAFPIQQAVVAAHGGDIGPIRLLFFALPLTLCFAAASWYLVEKPALGFRQKIGQDRRRTQSFHTTI